MSAQSYIFNPTDKTSAATGDGFSVPRLSTIGRLAISFGASDAGMMVYDVTLNNLFIWNGTAWESVPASGDAGANGAVQYNDNGIVSGASGFFWDKTNNRVGIGTASPALPLHVNAASGDCKVRISSGANTLTFGWDDPNGFYYTTAGLQAWQTGGSTRMTLDSSGNLLVGTTSGSSRLCIGSTADTSATANAILVTTNKGTFSIVADGATNAVGTAFTYSWANGGQGPLVFKNASGEVARLDASGRLLVGITSGSYQVDVAATTNLLRLTSANGSDCNLLLGQTGVANWMIYNTATAGQLRFQRGGTDFVSMDAGGNLGIGTSTFGTSAAKVLGLFNGTAPTTGPADTVQIFSVDRSAGNTIPAIYCEGSGVTNAGITNTTVTNKIAISVNGTVYYLLATTNAT